MSHIDNEFNQRFNNQQLPNDDFDTEGLWGAITEDLGKGLSEPHHLLYQSKWALGFTLLIIAGGFWGVMNITSDRPEHAQKTSLKATDPIALKKTEEKSSSALYKQNSQAKSPITDQAALALPEQNNRSNTQAMNAGETKSRITTEPISKNKELIESSILKPKQQEGTSMKSAYINDKELIHLSKDSSSQKAMSSSMISDLEQDTKNSSSSLADQRMIESFSFLPTNLTFLAAVHPDLPAFEISEYKALRNKNSKSITWDLSLLVGINKAHFKYQSALDTIVALKQSAEKGEWGINYGAHVGLRWKKHWLLNTGLEYHQLWSKFDYENKKNIQVLKENQLLKVWLDEASGDTLDTRYGDTLVNAVATQNILHYNQYRHFSIPLEIGIRKELGKLIYGLKAGAIFSFTTAQSGRAFDKGANIVSFGKDDSNATFKAFHIGLRVSPTIGYQIDENWNIFLQPQWTYKRHAGFDETDIKIGIYQFNMNIGLGYSL